MILPKPGFEGKKKRLSSRLAGCQFNEVGLRISGGSRGSRQRTSFFQVGFSHLFQSARNHRASTGQIKSLANDSRKIQHLRDDHPVFPARQVEGDVVLQHALSIREVSGKEESRIVATGGRR